MTSIRINLPAANRCRCGAPPDPRHGCARAQRAPAPPAGAPWRPAEADHPHPDGQRAKCMGGVFEHLFDHAQAPVRALGMTMEGAPDQIDPVVLVFGRLRKGRARHPYRGALERLGLVAVRDSLKLGDRAGAMHAALLHGIGTRSRARAAGRHGRRQPPPRRRAQHVGLGRVRLDLDPPLDPVSRRHAAQLHQVVRQRVRMFGHEQIPEISVPRPGALPDGKARRVFANGKEDKATHKAWPSLQHWKRHQPTWEPCPRDDSGYRRAKPSNDTRAAASALQRHRVGRRTRPARLMVCPSPQAGQAKPKLRQPPKPWPSIP